MIRLINLHGCKLWLVVCAAVMSICPTICSLAQENELDFAEADRVRGVKKVSFEQLPSDKPGAAKAVSSRMELPEAWWADAAKKKVSSEIKQQANYSLDDLIVLAIQHSAQVQVDSDLPLIRETAIVEADAEFDWNLYLQTNWRDSSDPVGNSLTVGGNGTRFRDHQWTGESGVRRKNRYGGSVQFGQQFGHQNNNSTFFQPNNQGTARLTMSYTQPLLRSAGRVYNESLTMLAQIDAGIASEEFTRKLQDHLLELARSYWGLHLERIALLQKRKLYAATKELVKKIESRQSIDSTQSQVIRAKSALLSRESDLIRATQAVRNAESRVRSLVNAPEFDNYDTIEIVPTDTPTSSPVQYKEAESVESALQHRPEIVQALEQIQAASVRLNMSENEVLPALNFVMESYVAGLQANSKVGKAWANQFTEGEPSYSAGFQYEIPINNRLARARLQRRQFELRQIQNQMKVSAEKIKLEVVVAVREIDTSYREMKAKFKAMEAAIQNESFIRQRWELLPGEDKSVALVLDDLLRAQKSVTDAEYEFAKSQITYNLALVNVKRAMGELLAIEKAEENQNVPAEATAELPPIHPDSILRTSAAAPPIRPLQNQ